MTRYLCLFCGLIAVLSLTTIGGEYSFALPDNYSDCRIAAITLSGEQYKNLGGHSDWLRLYDAQGKIIPWALEHKSVKNSTRKRVQTTIKITEVRKPSDGTLEIVFSTAPDAMLPEMVILVFRTAVKNFEQRVQLWGRLADGTERPLEMDGFIFDSTDTLDARNLEFKFSPGQCRDFRLVLSSASLERKLALRSLSVTKEDGELKRTDEKMSFLEQPFNAGSLELWSEQVVDDGSVPLWSPLSVPFEITQRSNGKTILHVTPGVYPLNAVEPVFEEDNYSRTVTVINLLAEGKKNLGTARLRRLKISGLSESSTSMPIPEISVGDLEIEIEDNDNPPLTPKDILVSVPVYRLKFIAEPAHFPLRLTAIPNAEKPVYDVDSILALGGNAVNMLELRPDAFLGETIVAKVPSGKLSRIWLFLAVGLAVAAMAVALVATVKKAE